MQFRSLVSMIRLVGGVALSTLAGLWLSAPLAGWLDVQLAMRLPIDLRWLGGLVIVGAMGLIVSAEFSFVHFGGGTGVPSDPPQRLVAHGPYRWVRNPLYVGGNALLWGTALVHNSTGLLFIAFIIGIGFHLFVVFYEEPQLEKRFGDAYREYKTRVPRWFPMKGIEESF